MRRKLYLSFFLLAAGVSALVVQQTLTGGDAAAPAKAELPKAAAAPTSPMPVKQVILFNTGVGYFQREGPVTGDTQVDLSFATSDINDLLKSLVIEDADGGRVNTVSYDSPDPVDKILHSFALDLNNNPSLGQILNQARGEKIEVTLLPASNSPSAVLKGTIVGMEARKGPAATDSEQDILNLLSSDGLKSVTLNKIQSVRFLNQVLDSEFKRALEVLAGSHDTQKKTVGLKFLGQGKRNVRVGYVVEQPIWKMSYRLRMEPQGKLFLQGWAMVDNTTDEDWKDVRLFLVSGRPISYKMNLHEPLYVPRPTVEPELFASLRPPVYGGALSGLEDKGNKENPQVQAQQAQQTPMQQLVNPQFMGQGCLGGFNGGGFQFGGGGFQMQGGGVNFNGGQFQGNRYQQAFGMNYGNGLNPYNYNPYNYNPNLGPQQGQGNKLNYDDLQKRRQELREQKEKAGKLAGAVAGLNFKEGIASVTTAEEIGDYYQYQVSHSVSLARQKSAMMPVVTHTVEGAKVSIFNESVHPKYPLLGLRLKNTSGQPLTQGPITVYEGGTYAGDTRILHLQPGEERLLSYALDQGSEVATHSKTTPSPEMTLRIGGDNLTARYTLRQTRTYVVVNRSGHDRSTIVEHPIRTDWKLVSPEKPERTRSFYRFEVKVPAGKSAKLEVVEEQARVDPFAIITGGDRPPHYAVAEGIEIKPVVKASLPELVDLKVIKGTLNARHRLRESKTYFIQNQSEEERSFVVDHIIRPEWKLVGANAKDVPGPGVYRFKLEVPKHKAASKEVVEERVQLDKTISLKAASDDLLRDYLASQVIGEAVRSAIVKTRSLRATLAESQKQLTTAEEQLEGASKDQARMRANLAIIPQSSEPYKKFLDRFLAQETEIDGLQRQVRQLQTAVLKQRTELEAYVATLNAE